MNYKTIVVPIISVIALALQIVFGVEIDEGVVNDVAVAIGNIIAVGFVVYGIFKNHKDKKTVMK